MNRRLLPTATLAILLAATTVHAGKVGEYRDEPDAWFAGDEGKAILANVLIAQRENGGWYKNYDLAKLPPAMAASKASPSIYDNMATIGEMRLLARAVRVTGDATYRTAFERGMKMIFDSQYGNGGWPQEVPAPTRGYAMQVTFNDDAMTRVLQLLKDVVDKKPDVAFVDDATRTRAATAFDQGVECILKSQVKMGATPTVWCAQYDEKTLKPAKARAYELPSLSGDESAGITLLLMSIDAPSNATKQAVQDAVVWFDVAKLLGLRTEKRPNAPEDPTKTDVVVVQDAKAEPLWARFYDLDTGKPFYCGRDGVKKATLAEIERERRTGYAWLRPWGKPVLAAYPAWAEKQRMPNLLAATR